MSTRASEPGQTRSESIERVTQVVRQFARADWADLVRRDQVERWQRGHRTLAEQYFSQLPELRDNAEDALVLICGEVHLRMQAGETVELAEYQSRFPQLASELERQFTLDALLGLPAIDDAESAEAKVATAPRLPGYEFIRELGRGASGVVYLAHQVSVDRRVAIKAIPLAASDPGRLRRQRQEASLLSRLQDPHVVQIHDVIEVEGVLYSVIEYIAGQTLAEFASGHPLPPASAAQIVSTLAATMHRVHEAGVVHRDLKPSNVLRTTDGQMKITDFGLAKLVAGDNLLTADQSLLGTPSYMSPEQAIGDGRNVGREADVYALGAILYELLTGRPPFLGVTVLDTLSLIRDREPISPKSLQPRTPRDLDTICLKCLEKSPEQRYGSAAALAADLDRFIEGAPILARRRSWPERAGRWCQRNPLVASLAAGLAMAVVAGFVGILWQWRGAEQARSREQLARGEADLRARETQQGMERLQQSSVLRDRARAHLTQRSWDDADAAFTQAIELRPDDARTWEERGELLYARLGLWDFALADFRRAFAIQEPAVPQRWHWYALLLKQSGDSQGFRQLCALMDERIRTLDLPYHAYDRVRTMSLVEDDSKVGGYLLGVAEVPSFAGQHVAGCRYLQALANCRAGRYEAALERCRQSLEAVDGSICRELNYPIQAIAYQGLGRMDDAKQALAQAESTLDGWTRLRFDAESPDHWTLSMGATDAWPVSCWDWLELTNYIGEARKRLGLEPLDDPRWRVLRARALAGLRRAALADAEYSAAVALLPDDSQVRLEAHRARARLLVHRQDYRAAAEEFGLAFALKPNDAELLSCRIAVLFAAHDLDTYRQECGRMVELFGKTTDPRVAHVVSFVCTLSPNSLVDPSPLGGIGQLASERYLGAVHMTGAVEYRLGNYQRAVDCFHQAANNYRFRAVDWVFLAMAQFRLGHLEDARRNLAVARKWIDDANQSTPLNQSPAGASWGGWYEKVVFPLILNEASELIAADHSASPVSPEKRSAR